MMMSYIIIIDKPCCINLVPIKFEVKVYNTWSFFFCLKIKHIAVTIRLNL